MPGKIKILIDNGEHHLGRDTDLARAAMDNMAFDLAGYSELTVDCRFENGTGALNTEWKLPADFVSSVLGGHLGDQLKEMVSLGEPGLIAVLGSDQNIESAAMAFCWRQANDEGNSRPDIEEINARAVRICNQLGSFEADAYRLHVPVMKWSPTRLEPLRPYRELLSHAKHLLMGETADLARWQTKYPADPIGYSVLAAIHGIGHETAIGLLKQYETVDCIVTDCKFSPDDLAKTKVNNKTIGRKKAGQIVRAFTGRYPEGWARA